MLEAVDGDIGAAVAVGSLLGNGDDRSVTGLRANHFPQSVYQLPFCRCGSVICVSLLRPVWGSRLAPAHCQGGHPQLERTATSAPCSERVSPQDEPLGRWWLRRHGQRAGALRRARGSGNIAECGQARSRRVERKCRRRTTHTRPPRLRAAGPHVGLLTVRSVGMARSVSGVPQPSAEQQPGGASAGGMNQLPAGPPDRTRRLAVCPPERLNPAIQSVGVLTGRGPAGSSWSAACQRRRSGQYR